MVMFEAHYEHPDGSTSKWTEFVDAAIVQGCDFDELWEYALRVALRHMPSGAELVSVEYYAE